MSRRVLVTGGSGFMGTNLVQHLLETTDDVVVNLDIAAPRNPAAAGARWLAVDICDADALTAAVAEVAPDVICHLAGRVDLAGATLADYPANVEGVANLMGAARSTGTVRRIVAVSSQLVCTPGRIPGDDLEFCPPNAYGESKVAGERLVRSGAGDDVGWVIVRPTTIWGPWFGEIYSAFFRTVRAGRYVHPRGVRVRKSFGYVGNAVHRLAQLLDAPAPAVDGRVLYLADDEPYAILDWAQLIRAESGQGPVREVPLGLLRVAARAGDLLRRVGVAEPPLTSYRLANMTLETVFDTSAMRSICGDAPFTLAEGTRRTIDWLDGQRA